MCRGCFKNTEQPFVTIADCHKVSDTFLFMSCPDLKLKVNNILNKVFKVRRRIRYSNFQIQMTIQNHLEELLLCRHQSFKSVHPLVGLSFLIHILLTNPFLALCPAPCRFLNCKFNIYIHSTV
jgi:hypothetical protein